MPKQFPENVLTALSDIEFNEQRDEKVKDYVVIIARKYLRKIMGKSKLNQEVSLLLFWDEAGACDQQRAIQGVVAAHCDIKAELKRLFGFKDVHMIVAGTDVMLQADFASKGADYEIYRVPEVFV